MVVVLFGSSLSTRGRFNHHKLPPYTETTASTCARSDCRIDRHATGLCTSASAQYLPGGELICSASGSRRNRPARLLRNAGNQGSSSTRRRKPWRGPVTGLAGSDLNDDCIAAWSFRPVRTIISVKHGV